MAVTLRFSKLAKPKTSPITLNFGDDGITLNFDQPWLAKTSPITLRFDGSDDTGEPEPEPVPQILGIAVGLGWQAIAAIEQHIALNQYASKAEQRIVSAWQGDKVEVQHRMDWASSPLGTTVAMPWQVKLRHTRKVSLRWSLPPIRERRTAIAWRLGTHQQTRTKIGYHCYPAVYLRTRTNWLTGPQCHGVTHIAWQGDSVKTATNLQWGYPRPRWVCSDRWLDFAPKGKVTLLFDKPFVPKLAPISLQFDAVPMVCHWDNGGGPINANPTLPPIDFKIPIEPQIRRSYLMQPQISCIRVSDGAAVVLKSVSIAKSRSQWSSSGSVVFSSRIDAERAANELLKISISGYDFYLLCESPSESKGFGQHSFSATCRGRLALLASPHKKASNYVNMVSRSFIGLMSDIVANTGWSIASQITDFTVPANAFSYAAKTPAEALNMMAAGIGAMLDVNDETQTITVIPQWPVVPWNTATAVPDVILHDGVILDFSEQVDIRPDANAVFVRGEQQGVAAKVKRFGTAGDNFCVDIVDKLITDNQAARMRGTTELANAGNKVQTSIRTKVLADLPPMRPGMLIGVRKGAEVFKSVCEAWSISASVSESTGQVTVNQTVNLLRNKAASGVSA